MFFLKQKTAYGVWYGLVGSERCIRCGGSVVAVSPNSGVVLLPKLIKPNLLVWVTNALFFPASFGDVALDPTRVGNSFTSSVSLIKVGMPLKAPGSCCIACALACSNESMAIALSWGLTFSALLMAASTTSFGCMSPAAISLDTPTASSLPKASSENA